MPEKEIDIDVIVAEIAAARSEAEAKTPLPTVEEVRQEGDLYACLELANRSCVEPPLPRGLRGVVCHVMRRLLGTDLRSFRQHDLHVLRSLNKIVKVLDGSQDDLNGEILAASRTRLDIVALLSQRIVKLEDEVARLTSLTETGPVS